MISSLGERVTLAPGNLRGGSRNARSGPDLSAIDSTHTLRDRKRCSAPSHPAATVEVGQLLDLGLALGHQRFELVSLAGSEDSGMVAAHAWAEARDCGDMNSKDPAAGVTSSQTGSRPRPPSRSDLRLAREQEELRTEVEWLRERVDNLSRELVLARRDSGRLAEQLKQEEAVGREQRRRADDAVREAKALREELDRLKEARSVNGAASRAALSDAHSRSVRMAERRRRQQAESLMQAYKGLYEDQLQTQHATSESYRSLTRGYSRLSADNKALRQETAASAASVALPPPAGTTPGTTVPKAEAAAQQQASVSTRGIEIATGDDDGARGSSLSLPSAAGGGDVLGPKPTAAESAAAVSAAAAAVAAAAGALAMAAASTDDALYASTARKSTKAASRLDGVGKSRGPSLTDCASTAETLVCSPFSDQGTGTTAVPGKPYTGHDHAVTPAGDRAPRVGFSAVSGFSVQRGSSSDDVRCLRRGSTDGQAYGFPRTAGGPSVHPKEQDVRGRGSGGEPRGSCARDAETVSAVAVPPVEPAPRWRGRSTGPGRVPASPAPRAEAVDAPKRSSSPTSPRRRRWTVYGVGGGGGGGGRRWDGRTSGEDGCIRIEPSRTRPHSI